MFAPLEFFKIAENPLAKSNTAVKLTSNARVKVSAVCCSNGTFQPDNSEVPTNAALLIKQLLTRSTLYADLATQNHKNRTLPLRPISALNQR